MGRELQSPMPNIIQPRHVQKIKESIQNHSTNRITNIHQPYRLLGWGLWKVLILPYRSWKSSMWSVRRSNWQHLIWRTKALQKERNRSPQAWYIGMFPIKQIELDIQWFYSCLLVALLCHLGCWRRLMPKSRPPLGRALTHPIFWNMTLPKTSLT